MQKLLFLVCVLLCISSMSCKTHTIEEVHQALGIPPDAKNVLMFGQASHLDWDWLNWFPTNVNNNPPSVINYWSPGGSQPTDIIFSQATENLQNPNYGYSVCEMGFLRRFSVDHPDRFEKMKSNPGTLAIVGGGITSPDNLLPHGEAFIRDYLTGLSWLKTVNITWGGKVWLPDDFGHDSQMPVLLDACGVSGVSFSRLPGACNQGQDPGPSGYTSAHRVVLNEQTGGLDFWWNGNDGSKVFTYYMPNGYCAADGLYSSNCEPTNPQEQANCQCSSTNSVADRIRAYVGVRKPLSATPYIYQAVGCDFNMPLPQLVETLDQWNKENYPSTGVYAVSSTFEHYVDLVREYLEKNGDNIHYRNFHGSDASTTFKPTPYWMGFYVSRVSNKQHQYETSRALMADEVLLSLTGALNVPTDGITPAQLEAVWNLTAPSTHHDYITGTATDYVFLGEQTPLLKLTTSQSKAYKASLLNSLAAAMNTNSQSNQKVVAFNQNGFPINNALVTLSREEMSQEDFDSLSALPTFQKTANGDLVTLVDAPSFGYSANSPSAEQTEFEPVSVQGEGDQYTLTNSFLQASVSKASNWGITSLLDRRSGASVLTKGNVLSFRNDNGNIYRFGYEEGCGFNDWQPTITPGDGTLVENGPLRTVVSASLQVKTNAWTRNYQVEYTLVASEPMLRIAVSGGADNYTTVLTSFDFSQNIPSYEHGTTYHWDYKEPFAYGKQDDFKVTIEAAHDFFIPKSASGQLLAAVYHNSTPSWGVNGNSVVGTIMRNSPSDCAGKGAAGHDQFSYTINYAIRVPYGLGDSSTGQPIKEALAYNTPVVGLHLSKADFSKVPATFSLATVTSPSSALMTVAKPGQYNRGSTVFRVYQASNKPQNVQVRVATQYPSSSKVRPVTALEEPIQGSTATFNNGVVEYKAQTALTSFQLGSF